MTLWVVPSPDKPAGGKTCWDLVSRMLCMLSAKDDSSQVPNGDPQIKQTSNGLVPLHFREKENTLKNMCSVANAKVKEN